MRAEQATGSTTSGGTAVRASRPDGELLAVARLAALIARVPAAAVTVVEDGRYRSSAVGLAADDGAPEATIWSGPAGRPDGPTWVRDASADPRFAADPWVDGRRARVRLYASNPLRSSDGVLLGALCVADEQPGDLDPAQREGLADLAATASGLLERRGAARGWERRARETEQQRDHAAALDAHLIARQAAVLEAQLLVAGAALVPAVVADRICRAARDVTAATGAAVVEASGGRLVVRAATGSLDGLRSAELSPVGSLSGRAVRRRTAVRCGAGDLDPAHVRESLGSPARSILAVPVRRGATVVGAVLVAGAGPDDLGPDEVEALELLAETFGAALTNARALERAVEQATTDAVTGLPGRSAAVLVLEQALARQDRYGGHLGVLLLHLDELALVNEVHGHEVGDELLRQVAARLSATVRRVDTAARYGGDEFVVVAENLTELEDGDLLVRRLAGAVGGEYQVGGELRLRIGATVAAALAPDVVTATTRSTVDRSATLLAAAQEAMDHHEATARVVLTG